MPEYESTLKNLYDYLSSIAQVYRELIPVLRSELIAIQKDDIESLNESLRCQQALLLKTNHFEEKIRKFQSMLNIKAHNLSTAIPQFPQKNQFPFFEILSQFEQASEEVRYYQQKCRTLLQSKLYLIDKLLTKSHVKSGGNSYDKNASEIQKTLFNNIEVKV